MPWKLPECLEMDAAIFQIFANCMNGSVPFIWEMVAMWNKLSCSKNKGVVVSAFMIVGCLQHQTYLRSMPENPHFNTTPVFSL